MGSKASAIHATEKEALSILYERFLKSGLTYEKLTEKLTALGKSAAFKSFKGVRGTTLTEFEDLCHALGVKPVEILAQAEDNTAEPVPPFNMSREERIASVDRKLRDGSYLTEAAAKEWDARTEIEQNPFYT